MPPVALSVTGPNGFNAAAMSSRTARQPVSRHPAEAPPGTAVFEQLVARNAGRMFAVARRILRDEAAARDCVRDAFLAAHRGFARFEGRSVVTTWLHTIVVHTALAHLKARHRLDQPDDGDAGADFDAAGCRVEDHTQATRIADAERDGTLDRARVRAAVAALPPVYRAVLVLRDIEGYSTNETAQLLEISPGATKHRLHGARIALRDTLAPRTAVGSPRRRLRGWLNRLLPYLLTCEQVDHAAVDYLDGALRISPRRRLELHLRMCADCRAFAKSYAATVRAAHASVAGATPPPDGLVETITDQLHRRAR